MDIVKPYPLIFILDDNYAILRLLQTKLNNEGFKNISLFTSFKDLQSSITLKPDIIILDIYLTGFDNDENIDITLNFQILQKQLPKTNIVIFSGESNPSIKRDFIKKGAFAYIVKDSDSMNKLVSLVHHIIKSK